MKSTINKVIAIVILILVSTVIDIKVKAISNDSFYNGEYLSGVYIKKTKGYSSRYETGRFIRRTSDGQFSYCLQPFVEFIDGKVNTAYNSNYETVTNMTKEKWERVSLLAYYGYGYNNHTDKKWYIITQMMIWKTVDSSDIYFTDTLNGNRISKYESEMQELETLVSNHYIKPSFDGLTKNISLDETITIVDNNRVLNKYAILESSGVSASISGNELLIKGTNVGQTKLLLENKDKKYLSPPIVYVDNVNQNLMVVGSYKTITSEVNVNVLAGKIKIIKIDSETNSNKSIGEAILAGSKYQIINSQNKVVETVTIDKNGNSTTNYLPLGNYTIREVIPSKGYYLDSTTYKLEIKENKTYEILLKGKVIKSNIEITRIDSETNTCKSYGETTLKGAVYGIYDYQNNLVDEIQIDENCKGISKKLSYGKYKVKEINPSKGYKIDSNTYEISIESDNVYYVKSMVEGIKSNIEITRIDSESKTCKSHGEATLKGALYGVYDYQNNLVDEITIDNNCKGISKKLPYGKYKVKEINPSKGYKIDNNNYEINIKNEEINKIISDVEVIKGNINIISIDSETKICKALGEATLKGAIYEIYDYQDNLVDEIIIDDNCKGVFKNLYYGNYKIKQIQSSLGYNLNEEVKEISINNNKIYELTIENQVIKNKIEIYKFMGSEDTGFLYLENGAEFDIINNFDEIIKIVITDLNGYVEFNLPYGNYKIKQVSGNKYYKLMYPFSVNITETSSLVQKNYLKNGTISSKLKITLIDSESNLPILERGVKFKIKNKNTNEYLCQVTNKKICEFETDENGVMITPLELIGGTYIIEELESPNGYILSEEKLEVEISKENIKEDEIYGSIVETKFNNEQLKGSLKINKKGETKNNNYIPLEDIKFNLFAAEDIVTKEGIVHYLKDELIDNIVTGKNGIVEINNLYLGKYYFVEEFTNDNYILDDNKYEFEITSKDNNKNYEIVNYLKRGNLEIKVLDEETKINLSDIEIGIYDESNNLIQKEKTNNLGKIKISNLLYGNYYIKVLTTKDDYVLNDEKNYLEINKELNEITIFNKKISGNLKINVFGENSELLENAIFEVYDKNDNLIEKMITNNDGMSFSNKLNYGDYYIIQLESKDDYLIEKNKLYFSIKDNNEIVELIIKNKKETLEVNISDEGIVDEKEQIKKELVKEPIIIDVPNTLSNNFILDNPELVMMVMLMYFYGKKRR